MTNVGIIQSAMGYSPHIEMIVRRIYRNKIINNYLSRKKLRTNQIPEHSFDFNEIISYLRSIGVKQGDILIVHSAYKPLKATGLNPNNIIDALLELIGQNGTLVMPVIRQYKELQADERAINEDISNKIIDYDVNKTVVWTGIISKSLMEKPGAVTSRFPLNTICAFGPDAVKMIQNELKDDLPAPNGINSAWKYCADKNAWVISLGTDLTHSLTMIHTAEDVQKESWPVRDWYRKVTFRIIDRDFQIIKTVLERHPKWGMLHFAERKLSNDLIESKIMFSETIHGVLIEGLKSQQLIDFLNNKNKYGYPYFWLRKSLKK